SASCSPPKSGGERGRSSPPPLTARPQLLRPGKSARNLDALGTWRTETPGSGPAELASLRLSSCARSTHGRIAKIPVPRSVFRKDAMRLIFPHDWYFLGMH